MRIHIVQKGDTLWKIAQKYGVDFNQLKSMNTHLSNPDQIMPGMKIKVPTNSGMVKKEMPVKEVPINKEAPITEHPFAQIKPPTIPVDEPVKMFEQPKEIIKEVPKPIYMPKPPQPIIPEIDINNYYMVNMAKMNIEQQQPVQQVEIPVFEKEGPIKEMPEPPEMEEPIKEAPEMIHPKMAQPPMMMQPMYPCSPCIPMTPVLPGSGLPCMPLTPVIYSPCHQPIHHGFPFAYQPMMQGFTGPMMQGADPQMGMGGFAPGMMQGSDPQMGMGGFDPGMMQGSDPQMMMPPHGMSGFDPNVMQGADSQMMMPMQPSCQQMMGSFDPSTMQPMAQGMDQQMMMDSMDQSGFQPMMSPGMGTYQQSTGMPMGTGQINWDDDGMDLDDNQDGSTLYQTPMTEHMQNPMSVPDQAPYSMPLTTNPMLQPSFTPMMHPAFPMTQQTSPMMQPTYPMGQQPYPMMQPMFDMPGQGDCGCGAPPFALPQTGPMAGAMPYQAPIGYTEPMQSGHPFGQGFGNMPGMDMANMYQTMPMGMGFPATGDMTGQMSYDEMGTNQRDEFDEDDE
ncbi:SafA/ExsA family spore coat assembly protein [Caldifermentibacillus hisashii]|uniref:SafA/ExsA family spore coat assembly protein n=1 Tax=Caldifermentibacillus hisashii TaxID=996558 RepID=UPI0031FC44CD